MNCLTDDEKYELALFFKRICFNSILECTDGGTDKDQAYRMIDAIEKLQKELASQGYNPR